MGEKTLVESQITDATELIKQLDSSGHQPSVAAWYYYDDVDEWRLIIIGKKFDEYLPKQEALAYRAIAEAINTKNLASISVSEVKIIKSDEPLSQIMKVILNTDSTGIVRLHFNNTTINGIFIKEMIILRSA
jgi:LPS sulfotransferase NodH